MVLLDVSIVNVALPSIRLGLHAAQSELQWVVSGYALTFGLLLVPAGRFGDLRGRRTVFVGALALFTLASAVCGAAPNAATLVFARLFQGLAGGTLTPQISATIQELFSGRERGKAFGYFGTVVGVSTAIGPLLGGLLIQLFGDTDGWRAVFYVNIPIGLVAIPFAWRLLPKRDEDADRRHARLRPRRRGAPRCGSSRAPAAVRPGARVGVVEVAAGAGGRADRRGVRPLGPSLRPPRARADGRLRALLVGARTRSVRR